MVTTRKRHRNGHLVLIQKKRSEILWQRRTTQNGNNVSDEVKEKQNKCVHTEDEAKDLRSSCWGLYVKRQHYEAESW